MNPIFWLKLAALVACLSLVGYIGYRIDRNAVERTNTAWETKQAAAELARLRDESRRDTLSREIAERAAENLAARVDHIAASTAQTVKRLVPVFPASDDSCRWPDAGVRIVQDRIDQANSANSAMR